MRGLKTAGVLVCWFILGAVVVGGTLTAVRTSSREIAAGSRVPARFPVIVTEATTDSPAVCRVTFFESLPEAGDGPELGYVVPDGAQESCAADLAAQKEFSTWGRESAMPLLSAVAEFSSVSGEGLQRVEVSATWDDDQVNRGWYVASRDEIKPSRYQGFGAGTVMSSAVVGLFAGLVVAGVALAVMLLRKGSQASGHSLNPE